MPATSAKRSYNQQCRHQRNISCRQSALWLLRTCTQSRRELWIFAGRPIPTSFLKLGKVCLQIARAPQPLPVSTCSLFTERMTSLSGYRCEERRRANCEKAAKQWKRGDRRMWSPMLMLQPCHGLALSLTSSSSGSSPLETVLAPIRCGNCSRAAAFYHSEQSVSTRHWAFH
jgi:hypothetical protein